MNQIFKIGIIHNPVAGSPKKRKLASVFCKRIKQEFTQVTHIMTDKVRNDTKYAEIFSSHLIDLLIIIGGDGSVHHTINGLLKSSEHLPLISIFPTGTGNDFARSFSVKSNVEKNIRVILDYAQGNRSSSFCTKETDIGLVRWKNGTERYFVNSVGMGMDSAVVKHLQSLKHKKQSSYLTSIWKVFKSYSFPLMKVNYDGKTIEKRSTFVMVCNGKYAGGKMKFAPSAQTDDQKLDLIIVNKSSKVLTMAHLPFLYLGYHTLSPIVSTHRVEKVQFNNPELSLQLDGEHYACGACKIELAEEKINLLLPK